MKLFKKEKEYIEKIYATPNLKEKRLSLNLSKSEVARRCGFSLVYYSDIEAMWRSLPVSTALKIEEALEIVNEKKYPCVICGKLRTKDEGGEIFTLCDDCWEKNKKK